jgi:predicted LPLAT superfamily acyltransferase
MAAGRANQGQLLLESGDEDNLVNAANELARHFELGASVDFQKTLRNLAPLSRGLVSSETRALLLEGKYKDVAEASAARLFGPAPPLFSVKDDPFLLATDYAMSLQSNLAPGWSLKDGYPVCERNGRHYLLMQCGDVSYEKAESIRTRMEKFNGSFASGVVKVWCCGPVFHTAHSVNRANREIEVLSVVSTVLVAFLGWLLFRSWRFVPQLLVSLGVSVFVALGVLFAFFRHPHVLTFVFGTTLIGLAVDYVYHSRAAGGADKIGRPLTQSLATSLVCFAPLLFAEISALRQMALFTMAGLVAVYLCAFAWRGELEIQSPKSEVQRSRGGLSGLWQAIVCALALVSMCGICHMNISNDPSAFYSPSEFLAEGEKRLLETNPMGGGNIAIIRGKTLQESLEIEEELGLRGLSAVVPSLKRQRENAALVEKLKEREGKAYAALTGLRMPQDETRGFLDPENVEDGALKKIVRSFAARNGITLMIPCPEDFRSDDPRVVVIDPRETVRQIFLKMSFSAMKLLGVSFAALAVLLLFLFRRRFFDYVWPIGVAFLATVGALSWFGITITCFTMLCFFVMAGLGLDYVIFHLSQSASETRRTVFFAFLSSLAGFGLLAFTDFPVTRSMGATLAIGLFFAYALSGMEKKQKRKGIRHSSFVTRHSEWHEQAEQSAGEWRMRFMWFVYRWFGKDALKAMCVPVMAFIYPFAGGASRALREFYEVLGIRVGAWRVWRHMLDFAWALADKTDACTLKKNLPAVFARDDEGHCAFKALVESGKGAFVISSHLGTIEVLGALGRLEQAAGGRVPFVHAFQQMGHDAVFMRMFMKHFDPSAMCLHAVEDIGVETAVEMQVAIGRGELVLMAGDRVSAGSAKTLERDFLGCPCRWPKGVFAFAKLMEAPIFFVTCVRTGWNAYEAHFREFDHLSGEGSAELLRQYAAFLEEETRAHPSEWHHFHDFFAQRKTSCRTSASTLSRTAQAMS